MHFSTVAALTTLFTSISHAQTIMVPTPWFVTNLQFGNIRHGTGGYYGLSIIDSPTVSPQGFNTTCKFSDNTYYFFPSVSPQPCDDPSVTWAFGLDSTNQFALNITHTYAGNCTGNVLLPPNTCVDNGTFHFSRDDVLGQQSDPENNFGQAGGFSRSSVKLYPTRAVPSEKCEFC